MAKQPNTAAREYLTPTEKEILEEYGVTAVEFDRARDPARVNEVVNDPPRGSEMVKNDKPTLELTPPKGFAQDVDREAFDRKWADELQRGEEQEPEQNREIEREPER